MSKLKNIIFDLGGVLINLDFNLTISAFKDLGFPHFEDMFSQFKADQFFQKLEKGQISEEDFYTVMLKIGKNGLTREQVETAWNVMLLDFREKSLEFLKVLSKRYRIFLLSNTNAIHLNAFNKILSDQIGINSLELYFEKTYYSHLVGLRKPDQEIFDFVLIDAGIKAEETLFIDDTSLNIDAANEMGFITHLLLPGENVEGLSVSF